MCKPLAYTEVIKLLKVYIKGRKHFYLKQGNLESFRLFLSWYLSINIYETYRPTDNNNNNNNPPWYIGNYELHTLSRLLGISISELYEHIKSLE